MVHIIIRVRRTLLEKYKNTSVSAWAGMLARMKNMMIITVPLNPHPSVIIFYDMQVSHRNPLASFAVIKIIYIWPA